MKKFLLAVLALFFVSQASAYNYFISSGDYRIMISGKFKHTIRQIMWRGFEIGRPSGYYGAILAPQPGKFIGAGHTEGGQEKVLSFKVTCDGKDVAPQNKMVVNGKKVTVEKISMFDKLLFSIRLELTADGLVETKRFIATADQDVHLFYAHIFCFNKSFTDYYALTDKGEDVIGRFTLEKPARMPKDPKERKRAWHVRKSVKYIGEYDAAAKKGVLLYYPEIIPGKGHKSAFWEVPYAYMKYYMMVDVPKLVPAGWESPVYTVVVRCFAADNAATVPQIIRQQAAVAAKVTFELPAKPQL